MAKQPESRLVERCKKLLEKELRPCWCIKLSDSFTRGLPDLLAIACPRRQLVVIAVECKTSTGAVSRIQALTLSLIERIGRRQKSATVRSCVVRSLDDLRTELAAIP